VVGNEQDGLRPCLVVSDRFGGVVVVVPLTTTERLSTTRVRVIVERGRASYAMCEQVRSVSVERIVRPLGKLDPADLASVRVALAGMLRLGTSW